MLAFTPQFAADATSFMETQTQEAMCIWECAADAWSDYIAALTASPTPAGVLEANTKLMFDTMELYGRAAGAMLADKALKVPLLSDA